MSLFSFSQNATLHRILRDSRGGDSIGEAPLGPMTGEAVVAMGPH